MYNATVREFARCEAKEKGGGLRGRANKYREAGVGWSRRAERRKKGEGEATAKETGRKKGRDAGELTGNNPERASWLACLEPPAVRLQDNTQ